MNLTELSLDYSPISDTSLELISLYCKQLRNISLKCCKKVGSTYFFLLIIFKTTNYLAFNINVSFMQLTDLGLKALNQCGSLESVNLGQASGLTDGSLIAICTGNPLLKVLVCINLFLAQFVVRAQEKVEATALKKKPHMHMIYRVLTPGCGFELMELTLQLYYAGCRLWSGFR